MCNKGLLTLGWSGRVVALAAAFAAAASLPARANEDLSFASAVNLDKVRLIALQNDGRFKTLDTMAREILKTITGRTYFERELVGGGKQKQDPVFTYLDMVFNPEAYRNVRVIYVKKKPVREALTQAALNSIEKKELNKILEDGLVSMRFLQLPAVRSKLLELRSDVVKTAKDVDNIVMSANLTSSSELTQLLRAIPPPGETSVQARWFSLADLSSAAGMPQDHTHAAVAPRGGIPGLESGLQTELSTAWSEAREAWRRGDAEAASAALNKLAGLLPTVAPVIYPPMSKLSLEHWYYKYRKMTWVWCFYMVAVVFLLMAIVYRWPRARIIGLCWFGLAFGLHTVATGIRWYLAGRIPNSNMFEAVTAAAWFGAAMAIFFELGPSLTYRTAAWRASWFLTIAGFVVFVLGLLVRGVAFHNWQEWGPVPTTGLIVHSIGVMLLISMVSAKRFLPNLLPILGAAVTGMVAMMAGYFMPISLDSDISNRMPVLSDVWLYIHTNMIIASYALIGIAYVTSAMYVVGRLLTKPSTALWLSMIIPTVLIGLVGMIPGVGFKMIISAWAPFLLVIVGYFVAYVVRLVWRESGARAFSVWEGFPLAATMVSGPRQAPAAVGVLAAMPEDRLTNPLLDDPAARKGGLANVLDGATLLLFELFFIMLWTGIIMGAIWADHSWGRPWGWDPKEVFALNTWIIFLILVHVRIKVQDKALWTAVLGVIGCSVMLFNWIVVNFFITGLHSYA